MDPSSCPRCHGRINPGELHACVGPIVQAPVLLAILEELVAIRKLMECGAGPSAEVIKSAATKAKKRETR